jgi:predicted ArsR family transcriptional regulator
MNRTSTFHTILERLVRIERMERGKVCRMTGRSHYNHQTWHNGRNIVRYVRADRVDALREAIEGYRLFKKLAEQYADAIIRRTRAQSPSVAAPPPRRTKGGRPRRL